MIAAAQGLLLSLLLLVTFPTGMFDVVPGPPVGQDAGLADGRYLSPTWGYSIRWDSAAWTITQEDSAADVDRLVLTDGRGSSLSFVGQAGFGGDASACLDAMLQATRDIRDGVELTVAEDAQGEPFEMRSVAQAYTVALADVPGDDSHAYRGVLYAECQTLAPGEAVLQRTFTGSPAVFDHSFAAIADALEGVFLPASAWIPDPDDPSFVSAGVAPFRGYDRVNAAMLLDDADLPLLLIGQEDESATARVVTFENVSDRPLTVTPANLSVTLTTATAEVPDQVHAPLTIDWEDGFVAGPNGSRLLAPGERATAAVTFTPIDYAQVNCDMLPFVLLELARPKDDPDVAADDAPALVIAAGELPGALNDCFSFADDALSPATGRPVFPTAPAPGTARETLISADGQLDALGRIPLARFTVAPGAALPEAWLTGPLTATIETGELEVTTGETRITVPEGNALNADPGTHLAARNPGHEPATVLILWLAPDDDWAVPLLESSAPGVTGDALLPEQDLVNRSAPRQFSVERIDLPAGTSLDLDPEADAAIASMTLLIERGSVVLDGDEAADSHPLAVGESRRLTSRTTITTGDAEAVVLLVEARLLAPVSAVHVAHRAT